MKYVKSILLSVCMLTAILPSPVQAEGYFGGGYAPSYGGYPTTYPGAFGGGGYNPYRPAYPYSTNQTNVRVNVNVNVRYAQQPVCGSHGCYGGGYGGYGYGYGQRAMWGQGGCGRHWYQGQRCGFGRHCCKRKRMRGFSLSIGIGGFRLAINTRRWTM